MKIKQRSQILRVLMAGMVGSLALIILFGNPSYAFAYSQNNSGDFEVFIGRPAMGESFYSGPHTLLYSIPINGWVVGYGEHPEEIVIRLEILKNGVVVQQGESQLLSDGTFLFYANVNPDYSEPIFTPEQGSCASSCHVLASINLPGGDQMVRVTAIKPGGESATKEVNFTVDYSHYTRIPVEVSHAGDVDLPLEDISIVASTRLYLWRGRTFLGETDEAGGTVIRVETLSEAPTTYLIEVEPVVVNGVLYESLSPEVVLIASDVEETDPVTLLVRSRMGDVSGKIALDQDAAELFGEVTAISLSDGSTHHIPVSSGGEFEIADFPIDRYLFLLDAGLLDENQLAAAPVEADLFSVPDSVVVIPVEPFGENWTYVTVTSEDDDWLPFAWIQGEGGRLIQLGEPGNSQAFISNALLDETKIASAPGFYSHNVEGEAQDDPGGGLEVQLAPQPNLQKHPWGDGELIVPADSLIQMQGDQIFLDYGWLWGEGADSEPLRIQTRGKEIEIAAGRFALEVLPNERVWLYLFDGEAVVTNPETGQSQMVMANQMIDLETTETLYALAYDPAIPEYLNPIEDSPLAIVWKPTVWSKILGLFGDLGIGIAKIITIVTYGLVLLSLFGFPIYMIIRKWRSR